MGYPNPHGVWDSDILHTQCTRPPHAGLTSSRVLFSRGLPATCLFRLSMYVR